MKAMNGKPLTVHGDAMPYVPESLARQVSAACVAFFKSRNMTYGYQRAKFGGEKKKEAK